MKEHLFDDPDAGNSAASAAQYGCHITPGCVLRRLQLDEKVTLDIQESTGVDILESLIEANQQRFNRDRLQKGDLLAEAHRSLEYFRPESEPISKLVLGNLSLLF